MSRLKKAPSEKVEEAKRNLTWISYSKTVSMVEAKPNGNPENQIDCVAVRGGGGAEMLCKGRNRRRNRRRNISDRA